jgi:hypothetical protein
MERLNFVWQTIKWFYRVAALKEQNCLLLHTRWPEKDIK